MLLWDCPRAKGPKTSWQTACCRQWTQVIAAHDTLVVMPCMYLAHHELIYYNNSNNNNNNHNNNNNYYYGLMRAEIGSPMSVIHLVLSIADLLASKLCVKDYDAFSIGSVHSIVCSIG